MIVVQCSGCQEHLSSPPDEAGKTVTCPRCGAAVVIPSLTDRDGCKEQVRNQEQVRCQEQQVDIENLTEAIDWLRSAAANGDSKAQFNLGYCYDYGQGVPPDAEEAVKWYRMAAEQGLDIAQLYMGGCCCLGRGIAQNDEEMAKWFRLAAEQGHAEGKFDLGFCYARGRGVPQNDAEAVKWYREAAEQGYADAQYNLFCLRRNWKVAACGLA